MTTTSIALFPGTDAIEKPALRKMAWQNLAVQKKVRYANTLIEKKHGFDLHLPEFMTAGTDRSIHGFQKLVLCSLATQVALFEEYQKQVGDIDAVMGLSLGDTARSVVAGLCNFEEALMMLFKFTALSGKAEEGASIHIRLERPLAEMRVDLLLEDYGLEISVMQNDFFFLAAGSNKDIARWIEDIARPLSITFKLLYPFPLHSSLMTPISEALYSDIDQLCKVGNQKFDIFSTVLVKKLDGRDELVKDSILNINSSLWFTETIRHIQESYRNLRFVNIGPAPTLLQFIRRMNLPSSDLLLDDWFGRQHLALQPQTV